MTESLSTKITILSFVSILLVLYIHSGFHETANEIVGMSFNIYLQDFISVRIARIAVPLFFIISGFLFFRNINQQNDIYVKMKRRVKTLIVPYLIAALFFPAFYFILNYVPWANRFINSHGVLDCFQKNIFEILYSLYVNTGNGSPLAFHLWFLRDLIGIVLLCPILYHCRKIYKGIPLLLTSFIFTYIVSLSFVSSLFWFIFGSLYGNLLLSHKWRSGGVCLVIFLFIGILETFFTPFYLIRIPVILLGIIGFCFLYDFLLGHSFDLSKHHIFEICCSFSFFIYLYHEPTINIVRKIIVLPFHSSSLGFAISYMLSPLVFTFCAICVGILFRKIFPKVYSVLVGGR